jgi:hypothetical protein
MSVNTAHLVAPLTMWYNTLAYRGYTIYRGITYCETQYIVLESIEEKRLEIKNKFIRTIGEISKNF